MPQRRRRRSDRALRRRMRSPGRPPVACREERRRFWAASAKGLTSEDTGVAAGASPPVGTRWSPAVRRAHCHSGPALGALSLLDRAADMALLGPGGWGRTRHWQTARALTIDDLAGTRGR